MRRKTNVIFVVKLPNWERKGWQQTNFIKLYYNALRKTTRVLNRSSKGIIILLVSIILLPSIITMLHARDQGCLNRPAKGSVPLLVSLILLPTEVTMHRARDLGLWTGRQKEVLVWRIWLLSLISILSARYLGSVAGSQKEIWK